MLISRERAWAEDYAAQFSGRRSASAEEDFMAGLLKMRQWMAIRIEVLVRKHREDKQMLKELKREVGQE